MVAVAVIVYAIASFLHFFHNAQHLSEYPNLPGWLTPVGVYAAWVGVTVIGVVGYELNRRQHAVGLLVLGCYGALGLAGLDHYAVASPRQHTLAMNMTIWLEALTALALIALVLSAARARRSHL